VQDFNATNSDFNSTALFSGVAAVNHFVLETVNRKATSKSWGLEML
jgi:hypothetical protein